MIPYQLHNNPNYSIIEAIINKIATQNTGIPETDYEVQLAHLRNQKTGTELNAPGRMGGRDNTLTLTALPQDALLFATTFNPEPHAPSHATENTSYDLINIRGRAYLLSITPAN